MKLFLQSDLPFDAKTAWSIFESPEFEARLEETTDIRCEVLSTEQKGDVTVRRLRYTAKSDLPTIAAKALGTKNLTYVQTNTFDPAKSQLRWDVDLPMVGDRVSVGGTTTINDSPTGCRRVVDGDISVRMRLVGGQIEKAVVAQFKKSMERAVDLARDIAREQGHA